MKRNAGFTLIELVIVIMILGILAVTVAPKMLGVSSDARASTLEGMKGAVNSASSLVFAKAAMSSAHLKSTVAVEDSPVEGVALAYGYPVSTEEALKKVLDLEEGDWTFYEEEDFVAISPKGIEYSETEEEQCFMSYKQATSASSKPAVELKTKGC